MWGPSPSGSLGFPPLEWRLCVCRVGNLPVLGVPDLLSGRVGAEARPLPASQPPGPLLVCCLCERSGWVGLGEAALGMLPLYFWSRPHPLLCRLALHPSSRSHPSEGNFRPSQNKGRCCLQPWLCCWKPRGLCLGCHPCP